MDNWQSNDDRIRCIPQFSNVDMKVLETFDKWKWWKVNLCANTAIEEQIVMPKSTVYRLVNGTITIENSKY